MATRTSAATTFGTGHVFIKRRDVETITLVVTVWIKRAKLKVGDKTDELVLDFRGAFESLEIASLERDIDCYEPSLGKNVRVYTFFGQERA